MSNSTSLYGTPLSNTNNTTVLGPDTLVHPYPYMSPLPQNGSITPEPATALKFKEGEFIFHENETPKGIYFLKSGAVKIVTFRPLTRGRVTSSEFVNKLVGPGEYFGFKPVLQGSTYGFYAKVLLPAEVTLHSAEETFKNPALNKGLVQQMARDLESHERNAQLHYLASVQERIAFQLALLAEKFGNHTEGGISINLRLTRNELAQLAGTINESLSRHLTEFKNLGLLDVRGKELIVKNLPALQELSGNFR
jgi:CRP-like cAMP-binding protein